jgi:hypothetical protein
MESPEAQARIISELPAVENWKRGDFIDPDKAKENFQRILQEMGEAA